MSRAIQWVGRLNDRNRPRVQSADDVYAHLFDAIVDQRLLPGTKLSELSLVETFGVGRRIVSATLQRLAWEKLVVIFANRGAFIAAPDADEVRDIFSARMAIEAGTTEAVASSGDISICDRLQASLNEERACRQAGRTREAIKLSGGFHILMAELSGSRILSEHVRVLVARTSLAINLFENTTGLACWHDHHDDLVDLCRARDVSRAVALMRSHIMDIQNSMALDRLRPVAHDMLAVFGRE